MNRLITTSMDQIWPNDDLIFLGEWCKKDEKREKWDKKNNSFLNHHWNDKQKLYRDYNYLFNLNDILITDFTQKLNKFHNLNYDERSWRIILGSWLPLYLSTMFDRWETIRIFFEKYKKNVETYTFSTNDNIFYNYGVKDFIKKVVESDLWNHKNFLRIINFKYKEVTKIEKKNTVFKNLNNNYKETKVKKNILKRFINFVFTIIDEILSFIGIRLNKIIIENFYHSKIDLIKIFLKTGIFPAFYTNTFNENKFKKNLKINLQERVKFFKPNDNLNEFEKYLYKCLINDFPLAYFEKFQDLKKSNNKLNNLVKKKIFTKVSYISNERFKIWLAHMVSKKTQLYIGQHGGCLITKLNGFLGLDKKISNKILTWNKTSEHNELQVSPVELLKFKKKVKKKKLENLLIVNAETARYPCKIQGHPFAEEYKKSFRSICSLIKTLNLNIQNKTLYRSNNLGYNTASQIKKKFNHINTETFQKNLILDDFKTSKLIVCTYPETAISEMITINVPSIILIPNNLYEFDNNSTKIIDQLKNANVFFDNSYDAAKHINLIWNDPYKWWNSKDTLNSIKNLKEYAFNIKDEWLDEWTNLINSKNGK